MESSIFITIVNLYYNVSLQQIFFSEFEGIGWQYFILFDIGILLEALDSIELEHNEFVLVCQPEFHSLSI